MRICVCEKYFNFMISDIVDIKTILLLIDSD